MLNTDTDVDILRDIETTLEGFGDGFYVLELAVRTPDDTFRQLKVYELTDWLKDASEAVALATLDVLDNQQFLKLDEAIKWRDGHVSSRLVYNASREVRVSEAILVQWRSLPTE